MKIKNAIFAGLFAMALLTGASILAVNTGAQGPISASPRRSAANSATSSDAASERLGAD